MTVLCINRNFNKNKIVCLYYMLQNHKNFHVKIVYMYDYDKYE